MKKFYIQYNELNERLMDRLKEVCQNHGEENPDYYNEKMLKPRKGAFNFDGTSVAFVNESVVIGENGMQYNHCVLDFEDICQMVDELVSDNE